MEEKDFLEQAKKVKELAMQDNISFDERSKYFREASDLYKNGGDIKYSFEMLGMHYMSELACGKEENRESNFKNAVDSFKESDNKNAYHQMKAQYLVFLANTEKQLTKKARLYKQAAYEFSCVMPTKPEELAEQGDNYPQAQRDIHIMMAKHYEVLVERLGPKAKAKQQAVGLFKKIVEEYATAGDIKHYNLYKGLCYTLTPEVVSNSPQALITLKKACNCFEKAGNLDLIAKAKSTYLRCAAFFQVDQAMREKYLLDSVKEIEKTSDKLMLNEYLGVIEESRARTTIEPQKRAEFFFKAEEFYRKDGLGERANAVKALGKISLTHRPDCSIDEVINLLKEAVDLLKSAAFKQLFHKTRGNLYLAESLKSGFIKKDEKLFVEYQLKASQEFKQGGFILEGDLYKAFACVTISPHLPYPQNVDALRTAAQCFMATAHIRLYDLVHYKIFLILSEQETDISKKEDCKKKALMHLKFYVEGKIDTEKQLKIKDLAFVDLTVMDTIYAAEFYKLSGDLESDKDKRSAFDNEATKLFDQIISNPDKTHKKLGYRGKGWLLRDREQFDESLNVLRQGLKEFPESKTLKSECELAEKLLVEDYRKQKQKVIDLQQMRLDYQNQLLINNPKMKIEDVPLNPLESFEAMVLASMVKAGVALEESRRNLNSLKEEGLRDVVALQLKANPVIGENVTRETLIGNGKTDIYIVNSNNQLEKAISECLVWGGESYYQSKKSQLMGNLTNRQKYAFLVTFYKDQNFSTAVGKAQDCIKKEVDYKKDSLENIDIVTGTEGSIFSSIHSTSWGTELKIYHLLFCLS